MCKMDPSRLSEAQMLADNFVRTLNGLGKVCWNAEAQSFLASFLIANRGYSVVAICEQPDEYGYPVIKYVE